MRRSFLATLFPASHAALLQRWRRGEWTHEAGPLQRLPAELAGLAGLTLADLLARHPDLIGDAYGADLRDGHDASPAARPLRSWERLPPAEALAHHRDGHTLVYWHIGAALPALVDDARSVARELGCLPPDDRILGAPPRLRGFDDNAVRVALSFTPAGAEVGLGAHFDQFDSIAVQLRGEKDWYLASDPRLQFPLHNEGAARSGLPAYLAQVALDGADAGPFTRVRLTPGAALLNPRGTFHATGGAADESLTLLLRFQFPAWLEVLTAALAEALSRAPELRQTAFGLFRERDASLDLHELAQHLARAGAELARGAALIDEHLLARLADRRRARFRLVDDAGPRIVPGPDGVLLRPLAGRGALALPAELGPACAWIVATGGADFSLRALQDAVASAGDEAWPLLRCLVELGLLAVRWAAAAELDDDGPPPIRSV